MARRIVDDVQFPFSTEVIMSFRPLVLAVPLALALTVPLAAAPAFAAGGGGGGVKATGTCTAGSTWKLKAKVDNSNIQIEAQVDSGHVGQTWAWRLADNGATVASGKAKTVAPSGSFSVARLPPNLAGKDRITLRATNAATGESCTGAVSLG